MTENAAGWPDVAGVLDALTAGIGRVFGGDLVGLYLTGSLSYGGFDHGSSDIDFLAVLTGPMSAANAPRSPRCMPTSPRRGRSGRPG